VIIIIIIIIIGNETNKSVLILIPRLSTRRCPHLMPSARASYRSISAAGACAQQQTSRTPLLLLSIDGTDRRTDGWTPDPTVS